MVCLGPLFPYPPRPSRQIWVLRFLTHDYHDTFKSTTNNHPHLKRPSPSFTCYHYLTTHTIQFTYATQQLPPYTTTTTYPPMLSSTMPHQLHHTPAAHTPHQATMSIQSLCQPLCATSLCHALTPTSTCQPTPAPPRPRHPFITISCNSISSLHNRF